MKFWKIPYWKLLLLPLMCYYLGITSNIVAEVANHNQMPVFYPGGCDEDMDFNLSHTCMTKDSHAKALSDWIYFRRSIMSPGDILIGFYKMAYYPFLFTWIVLVVKDLKKGGS